MMEKFERKWQKRFERFAKSHVDEHLVSGWSESGLRRRTVVFRKLLAELRLPRRADILDLGCGAGTYVRFLSGLGHKVTGLDYSLPSLKRAVKSDPEGRGRYLGGEAYNLPFKDESFDMVTSIGVLQTLDEPEAAISEIHRVLRPGGIVVVEFLNTLELFALMRQAAERVTGRAPRLHTYSPFRVQDLLAGRGFAPKQRRGIFLTPRWMPGLGRIFDNGGVVGFIEGIPGASLLLAHAFLSAAAKGQADTTPKRA